MTATETRTPTVLGAEDIRRLLPHRWPFLFVDRVIEIDAPTRAVGIKNVSVAEPHFEGHFEHDSVMPGVLIIEALAQLAGILVACSEPSRDSGSSRTYLAAVNRMRFRVPARPGDQLRLTVTRSAGTFGLAEFAAEARAGSSVVADGRLVIAI